MTDKGEFQLVVARDVGELNQQVTAALKKGWDLYGATIVQPDAQKPEGFILAQALRRESAALR